MNKLVIISVICLVGSSLAMPADKSSNAIKEDQLKLLSEQSKKDIAKKEFEEAMSAKYHYASDVNDGISDLTNQREEVRDGLKVEGFYAYSDGHVSRKVSYVADENGYRIVSIEEEPLDGPQVNPEGSAQVRTVAHGSEYSYSVEGDDKTRHYRTKQERAQDEE